MTTLFKPTVYKPLEFIMYSFRQYGQPKLSKPKELKSIKQALTIDYIAGKCKCQVFIHKEDVWVKHRDYFSELLKTHIEDIGTPLNYRAKKYMNKNISSKFIYSDNWGAIILRNEAWLRIKNLYSQIKDGRFQLDIVNDILRQQERLHKLDEYELCCTEMERFWERLVGELYKKLIKYEF